jgi:hypothetical protein
MIEATPAPPSPLHVGGRRVFGLLFFKLNVLLFFKTELGKTACLRPLTSWGLRWLCA